MKYDAIDLFAGCGGWSLGLRELGRRCIGIELDPSCRATRKAAGFHTVQGDVLDYGPADFPGIPGLIASPPCQTFSAAGKGSGRRNLDDVLLAVKAVSARLPMEETWSDARTGLVVQPLRWAVEAVDAGQPYTWVALEQVRPVLPVWEAFAEVLAEEGYNVVTGLMHAEQHGVPQTRTRAVLLAHREREVDLPVPTHSRYHVRDKTRLDPGVLPWVSMAEALGWGMTERPCPTVACSRSTGGPDKEKVGGSGARAQIYAELEAGRWLVQSGMSKATKRHGGEPAPTITAAHDSAERQWVTAQARNSGPGASRDPRPLDDPSYTIRAQGSGSHPSGTEWVFERPSTTIVGSFRPEIVAAPGYRVSPEDGSRQNAPGSVRVTEQEAAVLQSFPYDYPWQGSQTKIFQQIGNAIPPLLAQALLAEVIR